MGELKVIMPDEMELSFRKAAMERFGYSKGALSEAIKQAVSIWMNPETDYSKEARLLGDPVIAMKGMLSHVKLNSVDLQHQIGELWGSKHARTRR